jgi:GNAT superfamily N-acetyltransferase
VIKSVYDEYGFGWFPAGYHSDLYTFEESYVDCPTSLFWVCELDGEVVGCVGLDLFDPLAGEVGQIVEVEGEVRIAGCGGELVRLYAFKHIRGRGVGKALLQAVIEESRTLGLSGIEIWSDTQFTEAHGLYQRFGAEMVGERHITDPEEYSEYGLVLRL